MRCNRLLWREGGLLTNVDLQSARHATKQHVQDADVGGAAVEEGDAIEEEGECQAEFGVVPYGGAAVPARGSVRKCPGESAEHLDGSRDIAR